MAKLPLSDDVEHTKFYVDCLSAETNNWLILFFC